jgi:hypothetical protein
MHDPSERADADKPKDAGTDEEKNRRQKTPLNELAEAGDKKAGEGSNDISGRSLSRSHGNNRLHSGRDCLPCKRPIARKSGDNLGIKSVLRHLDPRVQGLCRVVGQNCHLRLGDNFTGVDSGIHMVHRAPGHGVPRLRRLPPSLQAGILGQERRVNVDDAAGKSAEERGADDPHESRKNDKVDFLLAKYASHQLFAFGRDARTRTTSRIHMLGSHAMRAGNLEDARIGDVRNDNPDFRRQQVPGDCA